MKKCTLIFVLLLIQGGCSQFFPLKGIIKPLPRSNDRSDSDKSDTNGTDDILATIIDKINDFSKGSVTNNGSNLMVNDTSLTNDFDVSREDFGSNFGGTERDDIDESVSNGTDTFDDALNDTLATSDDSDDNFNATNDSDDTVTNDSKFTFDTTDTLMSTFGDSNESSDSTDASLTNSSNDSSDATMTNNAEDTFDTTDNLMTTADDSNESSDSTDASLTNSSNDSSDTTMTNNAEDTFDTTDNIMTTADDSNESSDSSDASLTNDSNESSGCSNASLTNDSNDCSDASLTSSSDEETSTDVTESSEDTDEVTNDSPDVSKIWINDTKHTSDGTHTSFVPVTSKIPTVTKITNNSSNVTPVPPTIPMPTLLQKIISNIRFYLKGAIRSMLEFLGVRPGEKINPAVILMRVYELYKLNITTVAPVCYLLNAGEFSMKYLKNRLLSESKTCILDPIRRIKENVNGSMSDVKELVTAVRAFTNNITKPDKLGVIVDFSLEESRILWELGQRLNSAINETVTLVLTPTCFYIETIEIAKEIQAGLENTFVCIKEELDRNKDYD